MSSLFASAAPASFFTRTKRKLSGVGNALALDIHDDSTSDNAAHSSDDNNSLNDSCNNSNATTSNVALLSPSARNNNDSNRSTTDTLLKPQFVTSSHYWFCTLCRSVDVREVAAFALWKVLCVLIVVLAVADWVFFFKFVVAVDAPRTRATNAALWAALTVALLAFRRAVRAKCGVDIRKLADHLEIFISVSLVMVFATNIAFYLHAPAASPLPDLGFLLVPAQADDSKWRPLSDILTALMPVFGLLQTLFMSRVNRCRVITTFFRVATIAYALRTLTVALTSLPGPAPHCRPGSALYHPPQTWIDIVTRVGPMYGQFHSCGDLIFSGHMAYTNSALLLYLRTMDRHVPRFARVRWAIGMLFLVTLAALCIAGRKHYSVDVVLGVVISTLVFFHFEHAWVPPSFALHDVVALQQQQQQRTLAGSKATSKASALAHVDDVECSGERDVLLYRQTPNAVDFIC